jgi:hypothetical protein
MRHLILSLLAVAALSAAQGKQTFTGTITDDSAFFALSGWRPFGHRFERK